MKFLDQITLWKINWYNALKIMRVRCFSLSIQIATKFQIPRNNQLISYFQTPNSLKVIAHSNPGYSSSSVQDRSSKDPKKAETSRMKRGMVPQNTIVMSDDENPESLEMVTVRAPPQRSSKTSYPHILKDVLQDFSAQNQQFEINQEFNRLILLDDEYHVRKFDKCKFQKPNMDRYGSISLRFD